MNKLKEKSLAIEELVITPESESFHFLKTRLWTSGDGDELKVELDKVWFLSVFDQPLSLNRYYVIRAKGKRTRQTCLSEDMITCFCNDVNDVKPSVLSLRGTMDVLRCSVGEKVGMFASQAHSSFGSHGLNFSL